MDWLLSPSAVDDFGFDWTLWLGQGEAIASQTVTPLDGGITVSNVSQTNGIVSYRVSGGTVATNQRVACHITSNLGRQDDRTDVFLVRDR